MLTDIWVQVFILVGDIDHAVENNMSLRHLQHSFCIECATCTTADAEFENLPLTAALLTVIVHRHRLETSLYVHSILLQEEDQVGRGEEHELSADLRWLELGDLFLHCLLYTSPSPRD